MTLAGSEVYLNNTWLPRDEATVSVFDRGFIFGDGVYELVPAYRHVPFLAERHIARLERSLDAVGIPNPKSAQEWLELIDTAAKRQSFGEQRIYLQVTRGVAPRLHRFPTQPLPTVLIFIDQLVRPDAAQATQGSKAITMPDFRWKRGDIKSISLIAAVMCSEAAAQASATETILLRDGHLTEGASSNILIASDGKLLTPPLDRSVLPGVTLSYIDELAAKAAIKLDYGAVTETQLRTADEILLTSSGKELVAITKLDDQPVGAGRAGPLFCKLYDYYQEGIGLAGPSAVTA